jgi:hypothetical protein
MDCALGRGINLAYRFVPGKKNLAWICFYDGTTSEVSGSQIIYNMADLSLLNCLIYGSMKHIYYQSNYRFET